jgi:hypothetical protein
MKRTVLAWIVVAIGILTANTAAHAPLPNLDSCHDDLDRVRRTASDASDITSDFLHFAPTPPKHEVPDWSRDVI